MFAFFACHTVSGAENWIITFVSMFYSCLARLKYEWINIKKISLIEVCNTKLNNEMIKNDMSSSLCADRYSELVVFMNEEDRNLWIMKNYVKSFPYHVHHPMSCSCTITWHFATFLRPRFSEPPRRTHNIEFHVEQQCCAPSLSFRLVCY